MSQISWGPLSFNSGGKNSKIHSKNWLSKTQALWGLAVSLNYYQEKIYEFC